MPYIDGRRVSLDEWRVVNPVGALYGRTAAGEQYLRYAGDGAEVPALEPQTTEEVLAARAEAIRVRSSRQDRNARVVVANALGVAPGELPEDFAIVTPVGLVQTHGTEYRPWLDGEDADDEAEERTERYESEREATKFSEQLGLPKHKPDRPSQTPGGRHARYVRQEAAKLGISPELYDERVTHTAATLDTCPYRNPES